MSLLISRLQRSLPSVISIEKNALLNPCEAAKRHCCRLNDVFPPPLSDMSPTRLPRRMSPGALVISGRNHGMRDQASLLELAALVTAFGRMDAVLHRGGALGPFPGNPGELVRPRPDDFLRRHVHGMFRASASRSCAGAMSRCRAHIWMMMPRP
ncbi:hypothetical protein [Mesorhizobium sp. M1378]|uniref:hypothetical protein n=1 Tax=Mesorhizobium sp. M1378 TaxID=2957092 RepID=UPI0033365DF0